MRIGFLQFNPKFGEKSYNMQKVEELLSDNQSDLIVLPELFNTGYTFISRDELADLAEDMSGMTIEFLKKLSQAKKTIIVAGFAEKEDDKFYNSAAMITPDGNVNVYRKIHLFNEETLFFTPGDKPFKVYEINNTRIGLMICFDWLFPEAARSLALQGAQIVCHPSNLVLPYCQRAMFARSIENSVFIITANRTGIENRNGKELAFSGQSQIMDPKGNLICSALQDEEIVNIVDVDPQKADSKLITNYNDVLKDRRPEMYKI